jgi:hypothetical protein
MDTEKQAELVRLYLRVHEASDSFHAQGEEVYEMVKRLEDLTKDTTIRYAGLRMRVEARAAFEQAKDLREALDEMGKQMRGQSQGRWTYILELGLGW